MKCVWLGAGVEMIGSGLYQSCGNRGSVGHTYVCGLQGVCGIAWAREDGVVLCIWVAGSVGLPGPGRMVWCYVYVCCKPGLFV